MSFLTVSTDDPLADIGKPQRLNSTYRVIDEVGNMNFRASLIDPHSFCRGTHNETPVENRTIILLRHCKRFFSLFPLGLRPQCAQEVARSVAIKGLAAATDVAYHSLGLVEEVGLTSGRWLEANAIG